MDIKCGKCIVGFTIYYDSLSYPITRSREKRKTSTHICNLADFPESNSNLTPLSIRIRLKEKAIAGIFPIKLPDKLFTRGGSLFQVWETYIALLLDRESASSGNYILYLKRQFQLVKRSAGHMQSNINCRPLSS